jgi:hypothetical protein
MQLTTACLPALLPGMMGWRVGYIAYPGQQLLQQQEGLEQYNLGEQLLKVRKLKVCFQAWQVVATIKCSVV